MSDLTWRKVRHNVNAAGHSLVGRWRLAAALLAITAMTSMAGLTASSSAAVSSSAAAPAALHVKSADVYHYISRYFFESKCRQAGDNGIVGGVWSDYQCRNGNLISDYELWVRF